MPKNLYLFLYLLKYSPVTDNAYSKLGVHQNVNSKICCDNSSYGMFFI